MTEAKADLGLIGLAVMGQNLVLNMSDHGYVVAVFNRTSEKTTDIRFIIEGPNYGILCKCREENGIVTASIPKLKGILPAGQFEAKLEVVLDGKYFRPLHESIEFKPLVEFDITSAKARPTIETRINTTAIKVRVLEEPEQKEENMKSSEIVEKDDEPKEQSAPSSKTDTAKAPKAAKSEGSASGDKPPETWDQIVKKSITRPDNAPKIEKGDFDYDNVAKATPIVNSKTTSSQSGEATTTKNLPPQGKDNTTSGKQSNTTSKQSAQPSHQAAPKKNVDKDRAKQILDKINGFKTTIASMKGNKS